MQHTARTTLSLAVWDAGPEHEVDMVVQFSVTPLRPSALPTPTGGAVEDIDIHIMRGAAELPCPNWLHDLFAEDDDFAAWLLSEAAEQDAYARDCAADARAEDRRMGL